MLLSDNSCVGTKLEQAGDCSLKIELDSPPKEDVMVTISVSSSTTTDDRVTLSPDNVMFNAKNYDTPRTVTFTIKNDVIIQPPEVNVDISITYTHSSVTKEGKTSTFVLQNDDAGIIISDNTCTGNIAENIQAQNCTLSIQLASQPTTDVTMNFTKSPNDTRVDVPSNVTFTTSNWNIPKPITVNLVDDMNIQLTDPTIMITANTSGGNYEDISSNFSFTLQNDDRDTDGDSRLDADDSCPDGIGLAEGWTYNETTDADLDGCRDNDEDVDDDNDGLIEISSLLMLHNIRNNLNGTHYNDGTTSSNGGCSSNGCHGYELTQNLDFDTNGNGTYIETNTGDCSAIIVGNNPATTTITETHHPRTDFSGCKLDTADNHDIYFPVDKNGLGGWIPIGNSTNSFSGIFDGNGFTISNLSIRRNIDSNENNYIGFFAEMSFHPIIRTTIRNVGFNGGVIMIASADIRLYLGAIAGFARYRVIENVYSSISIVATTPLNCWLGGFTGIGGYISNSYTTADLACSGGDSDHDSTGVLVAGISGLHVDGIINSYSTGDYAAYARNRSARASGIVTTSSISIPKLNNYATGNIYVSSAQTSSYTRTHLNNGISTHSNGISNSIRNSEATINIFQGNNTLIPIDTSHKGISYQTLEELKAQTSITSVLDDVPSVPQRYPDPERVCWLLKGTWSGPDWRSKVCSDTKYTSPWDFGTSSQLPALTTTPGGAVVQR